MGRPAVDALDVAGCERLFRRHGLPLLVEGHTAGRDVFGRSAPFLVLVLLLELSRSVQLGWPTWANVLALLGALAVVMGGYALLNLARGRPWRTLPQAVDVPELAFFVLAPALAALLFGGDWRGALGIAVGNLVLLALVWLSVGYGLLSTLWWGLARIADELGASLLRLVRLLPLLLVFSLVLFFTTEVWQVFDHTGGTADVIIGVFFALLVVGLVASHAPTEARRAVAGATEGDDDAVPLRRSQLANVAAMVATTQLLQVIVVSLGTGLFFVALGTLTVTPEVRGLWDVQGGSWALELVLGDSELVLDQTLVRVATALATFTGLYYAISAQVDAVYRAELVDGIGAQLARVFAVRRRYLALLRGAESDVSGRVRASGGSDSTAEV
ncbi:hypothetical protein Bcav_1341 [Beutenbergia cavernae DSM 12333]|uniref:Integral membrane protein n=1 Tax=Beutenbergia cavernae (strain ATCC BAA-8 / DSM 12333 / CCUG 43141 / JCM 11478 / NBRC 16432 / NCIMB 13614 / HKI 0122) TaxID=471853 RepID=C5C1Y2_BEUC1|nr:hypothetical protein [Beutenbergia cavernae]ACQ79600.1 hypothetical protein Bcav_1341 [Beutenbergia cavernae DSM 12333]